jgi:ATP-dependent exoDNAse (exonuclease V) beta subunit
MSVMDEALARDAMHRRSALETSRSFLVQAPAGSGKTELLIQRYLALLAIVDSPQRVVAVTFTRKAASEMRERVIEALREARERSPVAKSHEAVTRKLADAALARADALGWSILDYPAQLSIGTIDSLCGRIARQAPLASGIGVSPRPVDDARALYFEAARAALANADAQSAAWRTLLARLDNDAEIVVRYVANLLARRDQWLRHVQRRDMAQWRRQLEAMLAREIEAELRVARQAFDPQLRALLVECSQRAAAFLRTENTQLNAWLEHCAQLGELPPESADHVEAWRALADWLLVKSEARFRSRMDRRDGIPPKNMDPGGHIQRARDALFARLPGEAGLAETLHVLRQLPTPAYDDEAWAAIEALLEILPQAAAELLLVFARHGTVDYAQYTLSALDALGEADVPSDLLMRLDLAIDHLLVDEFQDTSDAQYRLIDKLTAGWTPGDGRTLFAVGDPMQSIYRFRDAEVRLFIEARDKGSVGNVPVEFIDLARNFRSQAHVVAWVNRVFPAVLAPRNDAWSGAVAFAAAAASRPQGAEGPPTLELAADAAEEARRVVDRVQAALAHDEEGDVAILIRARSDLAHVLPALRQAGIRFAAVELDALAERQSVRDLAALTHALVQPADRLAALAVLRAPWCGLALHDLVIVAARLDAGGLATICSHVNELQGLTGDGAARLARICDVLSRAFAGHARAPLAERVRGTWLALGGPATLADPPLDLAAADDYFSLLRAYESGGDVSDWQAFLDELGRRYATSTQDVFARVKVMTLFKAKGLEFDTVIIPGLAETRSGDDTDLLRWRAREGGLLLATTRARGGEEDAIYRYLKWLAATEAEHELGRILYVGATRAKRRLHLVAVARVDDDGQWRAPSKGSALAKLWDALVAERGNPPERAQAEQNAPVIAPPLRRMRSTFALPALRQSVAAPEVVASTTPAPPFEWAQSTAAAIGTVAHRLLAQVGHEGVAGFDDARMASLVPRIRTDLIGEGVVHDGLARAIQDVVAILDAVRGSERGRWLFDPAHAEAASEWALAGLDQGAVVHVTLDRTFVSDGVRWIVDFKTGRHEGADAEGFMAREVERYRAQLERYARVVRGAEARPIRLALYYPLVEGGWREWPWLPPGSQAGLFEMR